MEIIKREITIRDIVRGYQDSGEEGIVGFNGQLNIRPPYQREFVYKDKQRNAVIDTVTSNYPLNTIYWAKNTDGTYEIIDGQQRTISFCKFVTNGFSMNINGRTMRYQNLTQEEKNQILNYKLDVYICDGTELEKLEWFRIINIAGEKLTDQELLNATYTGPWLEDAKKYFSKNACPAYGLGSDYLTGSPIRQEYLERTLKWISDDSIEDYMATHQNDFNASELWEYYKSVINWVKTTFPTYRREMKGIQWGYLYNEFKDTELNPVELETKVSTLMQDEEVTSRKGIYTYVLTGNEKFLSLRAFSDKDKRRKYEEQKGLCPICGEHFEFEQMQGDHEIPWSRGGKTIYSNLVMLCKKCNQEKSNR